MKLLSAKMLNKFPPALPKLAKLSPQLSPEPQLSPKLTSVLCAEYPIYVVNKLILNLENVENIDP